MKKIFFIMLVMAGIINAQQTIDKIVAVVDNEIILQSELDFRTNMEATQKNLNPADNNMALVKDLNKFTVCRLKK